METPTRAPRQGTTPAKSAGKSAQGTARGTASGAKGTAGKAGQKAQQTAKQQAPTEDDVSDVETDGVTEGVDDTVENGEQAAEGAAEDDEGEEEEEEEGDDDGDDIVPAGQVGDDGQSVVDNSGSVIGSVSGKGGKKFAGKTVDQEGDIVDDEGNVLGQAEPGEAGAADGVQGALGNVTGAVGGITNKATGLLGNTLEGAQDVAGGDVEGGAQKTLGGVTDGVGGVVDEAGKAVEGVFPAAEGALSLGEGGIVDSTGKLIGQVPEELQNTLKDTPIKEITPEGQILGEDGGILGKALPPEVGEAVGGVTDQVQGAVEGVFPSVEGALSLGEGGIVDSTGKLIGQVPEDLQDKLKDTPIKEITSDGEILGEDGGVLGKAIPPEAQEAVGDVTDKAKDAVEGAFPDAQGLLNIGEGGQLLDESGKLIGTVPEELASKLKDTPIKEVTGDGELLDQEGNVLGKAIPPEAEEAVDDVGDTAEDAVEGAFPEFEGLLNVGEDGNLLDEAGNVIGTVDEETAKKLKDTPIKEITPEGDLKNEKGKIVGKATPPTDVEGAGEVAPSVFDTAEGRFPNFEGFLQLGEDNRLVDENGKAVGSVPEDLAKKLKDVKIKTITPDGDLLDEQGNVLGKAVPLDQDELAEKVKSAFPRFKGLLSVDESGKLFDEKGKLIGTVPDELVDDLQDVSIKEITPEGDMIDEDGNNVGKAIPPEPLDYSILDGKKVTRAGKIVDDNGNVVGHLKKGNPKDLEGSICDEKGAIWDQRGKKVGQAVPLPKEQLADMKVGEFDDFPDAKVAKNGDVISNGEVIGKVVEGDPKKLAGKLVDSEGSIVDKNGNVLGRAERYEEPEEEAVDMSALAGKRVNKAGNVVDSDGTIVGKLVEGDPKKLAGKMCGKNGEVFDEGGNVIGRAELIPPSEREGVKEGPFSAFQPCTVKKDGTVVGPAGNIVGRVIEGDAMKLEGRQVDEDGDIVDSNGNSLGKAERWEPEEVPKDVHPASGLKVNKEGWVINADGDKVAKLTDGDLQRCHGKKIDDDGDVVDQKGSSIGSVTLVENLPPEGPTEEELEAQRKQQEEDEQKEKEKKIAKRINYIIEERMEKLNRILKAITDYVNDAEQTPREELDEEELVKNVRPLIEEGGRQLEETNKEIRQLDPDGKLQMQAKQRASEGEATPEENRLAENLKDLTGNVTEAIDNAKRKIAGMPHAKEKLNPLWALLSEPLFQILAAVGLLLSGVLGLVGKLLGGLGLGNLVNGVLGSLGLDKLLGGGGKKGKSAGGLPGGLIGGITGALGGKK